MDLVEISWLLFSPFGISHLQQQQIVFITVLYFPKSALFSTLQLYGIYSTLFFFDPPTQNTLSIYIYIYIYVCIKGGVSGVPGNPLHLKIFY